VDVRDRVLGLDVAGFGLGVARVVLDVDLRVALSGRTDHVPAGHGVAALQVAGLVPGELVVARLNGIGVDGTFDVLRRSGVSAQGPGNE
jgi:hypothetical protein